MSTVIAQSQRTGKRYFWIFFFIVGLLHLLPAINSFCILCTEPDHWNWLTQDPEVLDYLTFVWQLVVLFEASFSLVMMIVTATRYSKGES